MLNANAIAVLHLIGSVVEGTCQPRNEKRMYSLSDSENNINSTFHYCAQTNTKMALAIVTPFFATVSLAIQTPTQRKIVRPDIRGKQFLNLI